MELAGPVIQLLQWISAPISRCWKYHCGLQENVKKLEQRKDELNRRKDDINARLRTEIVEGETELNAEVRLWRQRVEDIDAEINTITQQVETVKCFFRARIGKNVIQKIEEVQQLYRTGEFTDGLVIHLPHRIGVVHPPTTLRGEATFTRKMEEVWALLMGDEVRKIGVYGMGGVGKTTLIKEINNRLLKSREKFDSVIWVTASKASSVIKLQDAVARRFDIDISKYDDETERAGHLYTELRKKKSYVFIIDDLWDVYPLHRVGIPEPGPQNGSKLVLTTRLRDVCQKMSCEAIKMERLSETESLDLFLDTVGREVLSNPKMKEIVNLVVKECACLPLAIVTIAGSLKGIDDDNEWKAALRDLKTSSKGANKILEQLKFSYDRLNDKDLQACLLYCSLFPEDFAIARDRLIEYLIAEEIIKEANRQADLERGQTMINKLVRACLLEEIRDERRRLAGCVKMHDLIRDMALQITSERAPFLVEAGMGLKRVPDEENWKEDLAKVSLMRNAISDIPSSFESPRCPKLSTLLLNSNRYLRSISDNFFCHMTGLGLLDLSDTCIENLPESISELVNLTALLLRECPLLMYVPSLAKLTALKRLDFFGSGIKEVPQGMENLIRLRYLEFGECNQLEIIPDGVFCKLLNLRYLSLNNQMPGPTTRGEELVFLRKLENLYCVLHDLNSFNAYVRSLAEGGPDYYVLQLGFRGFSCWRREGKVVYLINCDISESVAKGGDCPLLLPQDVEILDIDSCRINVSTLCELTSFKNAMNFKCCYITECGGLKHLFVYSSSIIRLLQGLEHLNLRAVWDLQGLIRRENLASSAPLPPGTFRALKSLGVCRCNNIKRLSIVAPLPNLEHIIVEECKQLVEIVATTSDDDEEEEDQEHVEAVGGRSHQAVGVVTLHKLLDLYLSKLPKLKSIPVIADNSLRKVEIWECPKLKKVPCLDRVPFPASLRSVQIREDMWESLEWDNPSAKDAIQSMRANRV